MNPASGLSPRAMSRRRATWRTDTPVLGAALAPHSWCPAPACKMPLPALAPPMLLSSPILVISGQIERDLIGVERGMLHEVNDQMDTIRPVTKWAARILKPQDVPATVQEAFRQLKTWPPRPVEIEIPPKRWPKKPILSCSNRPIPSGQRPAPSRLRGRGGVASRQAAPHHCRRRRHRLQGQRCPANAGGVPARPRDYHRRGQGPVRSAPLALGAMRLREDPIVEYLAQTDVVLAVGTRLAFPQLFNGQTVVQIDVDAAEVGATMRPRSVWSAMRNAPGSLVHHACGHHASATQLPGGGRGPGSGHAVTVRMPICSRWPGSSRPSALPCRTMGLSLPG